MKTLFIDMDGVLVNLDQAINHYQFNHPTEWEQYKDNVSSIPGIYRYPAPMFGAVKAVNRLLYSGKYDMYIASTASWSNPESNTDKRYWIEHFFGTIFYKRLILTHQKNFLKGDILIDDRVKNGAGEFEGELILFGSDEYPTWDEVLEHLL